MTPEQLAAAQKATEEAIRIAELGKKIAEDLARMAKIVEESKNGQQGS